LSKPTLDLRPDHLTIVANILRTHVPDRTVWVFGSRALGTAKAASDLDLAIIGAEPLDHRIMGDLRDAFSESDLPFTVDIVDWATTSEGFRKIIEGQKVDLAYSRLFDSIDP
jgi:type I restriction enzyme, S subunit